MWLAYSLLAAFLWAIVNYIDKYLVDKVAEDRGVGALILFSGIIGIPVVLSILYFFSGSVLAVPMHNAFLIGLAGFLYLCGILIYLYVLAEADASSVVPQLMLAPVITIFLGYFFLSESLSPIELTGCILIILGSVILTGSIKSANYKIKFKVFALVILASLFLALNAVVFKYGVVEDSLTFWDGIFWEHIGFIVFSILVYISVPSYRRDFYSMLKYKSGAVIPLNIFSEGITLGGNFSLHYGTLIAPAALVFITADGIQPFFMLIIGVILSLVLPKIVEENIERRAILSKLLAFSVMAYGVYLLN